MPLATIGPPRVTSSAVTEALLDAVALLLPVACAGCGAEDRALCGPCRSALASTPRRRVLGDGTPVHAGLDYEGVVREVLIAMKADRPGLARHLAPSLSGAVAAAVEELGGSSRSPLELCAVPSTRRARRRRGYDPVRLVIARAGLRAAPVFHTARPHPAQKTLGAAERGASLAGVFAARRPLTGRRFLLVDDVVTTGATLAAAAAALRSAGAEVAGCAAVASTPRRVGNLRGDPAPTQRRPSAPAW
jgi:predicted amidophosphoribosyltransferase